MINEWSVSAHPDIASFVPYEWEFNFYFRDFELVFLANQFNWVDCTNDDENSKFLLALISFILILFVLFLMLGIYELLVPLSFNYSMNYSN